MYKNTKKYKWSQRSEDRAINREIIDGFIGIKKCTLLTNKKFICEDFKGASLKKGKEKFCNCADFVNCPAFNQYVSHEIIRNRRKAGKLN